MILRLPRGASAGDTERDALWSDTERDALWSDTERDALWSGSLPVPDAAPPTP